jgi:hypothetical protein
MNMKHETKRTRGKIYLAISAILAALALALVVSAQETKSQEQVAGRKESMPSMMGMMEQCQQQCNSSMKQCQIMMSKLREVRNSSDAAKMRAAIDDAVNMCARVNQNMSTCMANMTNSCMGMMRMMERMHGGMDKGDIMRSDNPTGRQ